MRQGRLSIRMVAGYAKVGETERFFGCGGPIRTNRQSLSIPFRSELIHCAV